MAKGKYSNRSGIDGCANAGMHGNAVKSVRVAESKAKGAAASSSKAHKAATPSTFAKPDPGIGKGKKGQRAPNS